MRVALESFSCQRSRTLVKAVVVIFLVVNSLLVFGQTKEYIYVGDRLSVIEETPQAPPSISSISPTSGNVGTDITITGTGFHAIQGTGKVRVGGSDAFIVSWSETQIVARPVGNYEPGTYTLVVETDQGPSNSKNFAILPQIDTIAPSTSLRFGARVTITGRSFGTTSGTQLKFGNGVINRSSCISWTNIQIVADVPWTATPGTIAVSANWIWGNSVDYTLLSPHISSSSPTSGNTDTNITITGAGFHATQGNGQVSLGGLQVAVTSWSDTQIVAHGAGNCEPGTYALVVETDQGPSNSKNFAILPQIDTIAPSTSLRFGARVTITGRSFGTTSGTQVKFGNGVIGRGSCVSWTNTQIVVDVPSTATPGTMAVSADWIWGNSVNYTLLSPYVSSISPAYGPAGTQVTITGENFGTRPANDPDSYVTFGGVAVQEADYLQWTTTGISVRVPPGVPVGSVELRVTADMYPSNPKSFSAQ